MQYLDQLEEKLTSCFRGKGEWNGKWSDSDTKRWTRQIKAELGYIPGDDGEFWMSAQDCLSNFDQFYWGELYPDTWPRIRMAGEWRGRTAGGVCFLKRMVMTMGSVWIGCVNHRTWNQNPQLVIECTQQTKAMVSACVKRNGYRISFGCCTASAHTG